MAEESKVKRKTRTSTAVKRRYNEKHYKKFQAYIKIELHEKIIAYTSKKGISKSEFLQKAIELLDKEES